MKKVLVTGAQGFIGKNLISYLVEHEVCGLDSEYLSFSDWKARLHSKLEEFHPDVVFHVGACAGTLEKRVNYMMIRNYESTKELVNWCKVYDVPFIYSSSAAAYGITKEHPSNLYGWSKYMAEDYVLLNNGVALRYFNVYGPGESHKGKMASVVYQAFLNHRTNGEAMGLFPKTPRRDFVYVEDVVSANLHAWENYRQLSGRYFEVGSGDARTFEEMMDILGISYFYRDIADIPEGYQFFTQSNKNKWMSGWEPCYDLKKGLSRYLEVLNEEFRETM